MKYVDLLPPALEAARLRTGPLASDERAGANGAFTFWYRSVQLRMVVSDGLDPDAEGWEHVSVSLANRCPTWDEMCFARDLWWGPDEVVVQFHPRHRDYINNHPFTLHLWRQIGVEVPLPPRKLV